MTVYKIGDTVQVVVTVKNNSSVPATGTSVNIPLTELVGLLYISHVADQGTFDGTDWTVGTVAALDEVSITIDLSVENDCTESFGPMTCEVTSDNDLVEANNTIVKTVEGGIPCCEIRECVDVEGVLDQALRWDFGPTVDGDITLTDDYLFKYTPIIGATAAIDVPSDTFEQGDWFSFFVLAEGTHTFTATGAVSLVPTDYTSLSAVGGLTTLVCMDDTQGANIFAVINGQLSGIV